VITDIGHIELEVPRDRHARFDPQLIALRVKIRDEGLIRNKAVHIALGVRADGTKEILGLWLEAKWSASGHGR
jgi:transposase-like protein